MYGPISPFGMRLPSYPHVASTSLKSGRISCKMYSAADTRFANGNKGFKKEMNFEEIKTFLQDLLENEKVGNDILLDPYVL